VNTTCTYNDSIGDLLTSGLSAAGAGTRVFLTGGADISADIALILSAGQFGADLWNQWTSHPAADAKDFIKNAKPTIVNIDPYDRIIKVIAVAQQINPKAVDVNAKEWILWYRQSYREDYKTLSPDVKIYWNDYLTSVKSAFNNPNNMNADLDLARFNESEINYNATPIETVSNILTSGQSSIKYVLYGGIGLLLVYLLSKK
jgi:hypothetical protein